MLGKGNKGLDFMSDPSYAEETSSKSWSNSERRSRLFDLALFSVFLLSLSTQIAVLRQSPMNGFEGDFYKAAGPAWTLAVILGFSVASIEMIRRVDGRRTSRSTQTLLGLSMLTAQSILLLSSPSIRYELPYGRWDAFYHLAWVRDIIMNGNASLETNPYPAMHILIAAGQILGGGNLDWVVLPTVFSLRIVLVFLLARLLSPSRMVQSLAAILAAIPDTSAGTNLAPFYFAIPILVACVALLLRLTICQSTAKAHARFWGVLAVSLVVLSLAHSLTGVAMALGAMTLLIGISISRGTTHREHKRSVALQAFLLATCIAIANLLFLGNALIIYGGLLHNQIESGALTPTIHDPLGNLSLIVASYAFQIILFFLFIAYLALRIVRRTNSSFSSFEYSPRADHLLYYVAGFAIFTLVLERYQPMGSSVYIRTASLSGLLLVPYIAAVLTSFLKSRWTGSNRLHGTPKRTVLTQGVTLAVCMLLFLVGFQSYLPTKRTGNPGMESTISEAAANVWLVESSTNLSKEGVRFLGMSSLYARTWYLFGPDVTESLLGTAQEEMQKRFLGAIENLLSANQSSPGDQTILFCDAYAELFAVYGIDRNELNISTVMWPNPGFWGNERVAVLYSNGQDLVMSLR